MTGVVVVGRPWRASWCRTGGGIFGEDKLLVPAEGDAGGDLTAVDGCEDEDDADDDDDAAIDDDDDAAVDDDDDDEKSRAR